MPKSTAFDPRRVTHLVGMRASIDSMIKSLDTLPDEVREVYKGRISTWDDPEDKVLARLVRLCAPTMLLLKEGMNTLPNIKKVYADGIVPLMYMALPATDATIDESFDDSVTVFPNVLIDASAIDETLRSYSTLKDVKHTFRHYYAARDKDIAEGGNAAKKWDGTRRRIKLINRRNKTTMARALGASSNLFEVLSATKDHEKRDICTRLLNELQPVTVSITKTPQDFHAMYVNGPDSCMTSSGDSNREWSGKLMAAGYVPTSFMGFNPYTCGAFIHKGNKVYARVILFCKSGEPGPADDPLSSGTWSFGRAFSSSTEQNNVMMSALEGMGVKSGTNYNRPVDFTIPGIAGVGGAAMLPMPYFDNWSIPVWVSFDKTTSIFHISINKNEPGKLPTPQCSTWQRQNCESTRGIRTGADFTVLECKSCNRKYDPGTRKRHFHSETGDFACTDECMSSLGWVSAKRSDGTYVVKSAEDCVVDAVLTSNFYTNEQAIIELGGGPASQDVFTVGEEGCLTLQGFKVTLDSGQVIMSAAPVSMESLSSLPMNRLPKERLSIKRVKEARIDVPNSSLVLREGFDKVDLSAVEYPVDKPKGSFVTLSMVSSLTTAV